MEWISPTGHLDPNAKWSLEERAYDENLSTYACTTVAVPVGTWSAFLHLTVAAISDCSAIRYYLDNTYWFSLIDIDVKRDGEWVHVYEGDYPNATWVEKTFAEGSVTEARIRFYSAISESSGCVREFDFGRVAEKPTRCTQLYVVVNYTP